MKIDIKKILRAHNMTAQELAEKMGVSRQTVYSWTDGGKISRRMLRQMELLNLIVIETIPEQVIVHVTEGKTK